MSKSFLPLLLLGTLVVLGTFPDLGHGLFEDQIGKFDWHQQFFGPIRFILNDLTQPKRIIVGTENNIIGALNSNTGAILYRQILEPSAKLLYLGNYGDKGLISVSSEEDQIKIRTFALSTGIIKDSDLWALKAQVTHAVEIDSRVILVNAGPKSSSVSILTFNLLSSSALSEDESIKSEFQKREVKLGLDNPPSICQIISPYLVCASGKSASIVHLRDRSVTTRYFPELPGDVTEILGSGSNELTVAAVKGIGFVTVFRLLVNPKAGPELLPIPFSATSMYMTMSQSTVRDSRYLFITHLVSGHSIKVEAYNMELEKNHDLSFEVKGSMLIPSMAISKVYCVNSQCGLVGFTKDELLFGTKPVLGSSGSIEWTKQEALSSTLAVEMVDFPSEVGPSWNPYSAQQNVLSAFISRLKFEAEALITGESLYASSQDRFGLRKVIVFVTAVGKVIGMDSATGQVLYTFLLPDFSTFDDSMVFLFIQRPAKYAPLKPLASVVYPSSRSKSTVLFAFNPVEGKHLDEPRIFPPILQCQMLLHGYEESQFLKPVLLLDASHVVHTYPPKIPDLQNTYFFVADKSVSTSPVLQGMVIKSDQGKQKLSAKNLWDLKLPQGELLGVYGKLPCERIHSQGRVLPDRSVSYKYMNPNLVVVVTAEPEAGNINLFFVDAVSGSVIHSLWHKKAKGPVHVVHSEHWTVYSLFNEKHRRFEVNAIELYEGQSQSNFSAFSSFAIPPVSPIVVKQSFIFPVGVQAMSYTRTEKGITNKDILIGLPTGAVLELPRIVLQPRLSPQHYIHQTQDEDGVVHSVPYIPELPVPADMIVNYNQSVRRIKGIKTWPTRLESTCLVLVYGTDLFYTKVTPSKDFDVLKDDFDHWFITIVLAGLCAAAYACKRLAARKSLEQAWR